MSQKGRPSSLWILLGAAVGAFGLTYLALRDYRPDSTWGDLSFLAGIMSFGVGAIGGGALVAFILFVIDLFKVGQEANLEYETLSPADKAANPREFYVLFPVFRCALPFLIGCFLILFMLVRSMWKIAQDSNPWSAARMARPTITPPPKTLIPTVVPTPFAMTTATALAPPIIPTTPVTSSALAIAAYGVLYYPGSQIYPTQAPASRPAVAYSLLLLTSRDSFSTVTTYYRQHLTMVRELSDRVIFRGPRPGDGKDTFVEVKHYDDSQVFINLSCH